MVRLGGGGGREWRPGTETEEEVAAEVGRGTEERRRRLARARRRSAEHGGGEVGRGEARAATTALARSLDAWLPVLMGQSL